MSYNDMNKLQTYVVSQEPAMEVLHEMKFDPAVYREAWDHGVTSDNSDLLEMLECFLLACEVRGVNASYVGRKLVEYLERAPHATRFYYVDKPEVTEEY